MTLKRKKELETAIIEATVLGQEAFKRGACGASAMDKRMNELLERIQLKVEEGMPVLKAWNTGYDNAKLAEARKILISRIKEKGYTWQLN